MRYLVHIKRSEEKDDNERRIILTFDPTLILFTPLPLPSTVPHPWLLLRRKILLRSSVMTRKAALRCVIMS
jgi:hypothetical protein